MLDNETSVIEQEKSFKFKNYGNNDKLFNIKKIFIILTIFLLLVAMIQSIIINNLKKKTF